ncbi:MAG: hypothetical protein IPI42_08665 [Saprospiraceae bacterium]|nr:hypothetical protein [Candidatus Parvibacillus calidus]
MGLPQAIDFHQSLKASQLPDSLPQLVMKLGDWKTVIEMELKNNVPSYETRREANFFQMEYPGKVCNIHNINLTFKGSGSVDWIRYMMETNQV